MGWLRQVPLTRIHECVKPPASVVGVGSQWRCDDCGKTWEVTAYAGPTQIGRRHGDHEWRVVPNPPAPERASSSDTA